MSATALRLVGYNFDAAFPTIVITTATRRERWPAIQVQQLAALGELRSGFTVLAHDLPRGSGADGLLGLDFFAGRKLCFDLREGYLELT